MNRAWITNPSHPFYPMQGTVVGHHLNKDGKLIGLRLVLAAEPILGVGMVYVRAKDAMPVVNREGAAPA